MSTPETDLPDDELSSYEIIKLKFNPNVLGMIALDISTSTRGEPVTIYLSTFRDPINDMVLWLEQIADRQIPAAWAVKSEVSEKAQEVLWASPLPNDRLTLRLTTSLELHENMPCKLQLIVRREQFVKQFIQAFKNFVRESYQPAHWVSDLRAIDLS